ncbi:helix-turn-helix domain-containing protein [Mordavella massiliensis]|uniref:Helix-turn-helix transcriptional regulator n=1 Tax=Mordavella massiliensis TaxID=1871024 RepID=A0A938XE51_9CLOT|nr:helix-turn-helix transcriptional regulator [Mordavella massiliensis]MBM6949048.1 helix-turn-helix transcriptional regulator [Mordavella massiliensis]
MSEFKDFLNEQLKEDEFRKEYDALQPEFDIIRAIVEARTSQNLTQKELAERTGINQADISKLENGTRNPSLKLLKRLADGMGMDLKLSFVPKKHM